MADPDKSTFTPGIDFTTLFGGYATALTQSMELATPNSLHGILFYNEVQPAITGQPAGYPTNWYAFNQRGLWIKPSTGETFAYVTGIGFRNIATQIPANTITGTMIVDGTIPLSKINVSTGTAGNVPTVNAGGTALEYADPVNGRVDGSIAVAKLAPGTANQFLRTIGGITAWDTFDGTDINALLAVTKLTESYLTPGAPLQVLATDATANFSTWLDVTDTFGDGSIAPAKLAGTGGVAGQFLKRNSTNTGWEWGTPAGTAPISVKWTSALLTISDQTVAHTPDIVVEPAFWQAKVVCIDAGGDAGFPLNRKLDYLSVVADISFGNSEETPYITISSDATNFYVKLTAAPAQIYVTNGTTGAAKQTWDPAKWRIEITALN